MLLILMGPHASILKYYWFSGDLILAYQCIIDFHGISFQHIDVLLILMWLHPSILMFYWFSCYFITAYRGIVDSHGTSSSSEKQRLLNQGYEKIRLIRSLKQFIFRYQDIVEIYSVSAEKIINDGFSNIENV